ncbi:hypothetical protein ACFXJJ_27485, partial [Streptomyces sp. NPDC059233]
VLSLRQLADLPDAHLLDLPAATRSGAALRTTGPETIGGLVLAGVDRLDPALRTVLRELVAFDAAPTVSEAAEALRRPLNRVVEDLGTLMGCGFVRASHEEAETRLRLPDLLRAALARR